MLGEKNAEATIPVKDIARARKFYEGILGLQRENSEEPSVQTYKSGSVRVLVYESSLAGTNKATAVTWEVGDGDREVGLLKDKGVAFEHYDMPGMKRQGDVHLTGQSKAAWFKDPDGNILAIVGRRAAVH